MLQKDYLDFLRDLFKGQPYVSMVYMTGILPIKKYGTHSALNMFDDMTTFKSKNNILTLLVHLGYLSYDKSNETVFIPNEEIRREFVNAMDDSGWSAVIEAVSCPE